MAVNVNKTSIKLDQDDREFIDFLKNEVNGYGELPYNLNEQAAVEIIKVAAKWFYRWDHNAVIENLWGLIKKDDIVNYLTDNGSEPLREIATFAVKLPPAVESVTDVFERGSTWIDPDITAGAMQDTIQVLNRQYNSSMSGGTSLLGINNNLYIQESVCRFESNNVYESCISVMIDFAYERHAHLLTINTNLSKDIIIRYDQDIPLKYLYQYDVFKNYVKYKCFQHMRRIVGGHTVELPSGATVNIDEIFPIDQIEAIETQIKAGSGIGDCIIWRQ